VAQINQGSVSGVPEVLVRFRDAVGVGRVSGPKIEEGRQPLYWWVASSRGDVARAGSLIGPWLSGEKRTQFRAAAGMSVDGAPIDSSSWAAGFFDAEGSTSLGDHRSHAGYKVVEASITQSAPTGVPEELTRFKAVVDAGIVYGPYAYAGATEPVYRWRLQGADNVRGVLHLLQPWLGPVKRRQAFDALAVIDRQSTLPRGRIEWGSHKTQCIRGHDYATARLRPYVARRPDGVQRRDSKQCLACVREQARARRRRD
jgi:hypothetical protein